MGKNTSVIELNGNRYDAVTGQLVGAVKRVANRSKAVKSAAGLNIDGFNKQPAGDTLRHYATKAKSSVTPILAQTAQNVHRGAQRSRTLMRSAVHKSTVASVPKAAPTPDLKARTANVPSARASRAKTTPTDSHIKRFGRSLAEPVKPLAEVGEVMTPKAQKNHAASVGRPLPSMITSVSHNQIERLLDQALFRADAHKQALRHAATGKGMLGRARRAPRWASIGAVSLVVLLLGGFFAWQNMPQVALRVAATRAHVSASVPSYTPSGFSFANVTNPSEGAVTINFKANSDASRTFALTQKTSTMDSLSLASTAIPKDMPVQTSQVNGTTVYIYGQNNDAAWVNHGVLYKIKDNANLNSDQLLRIANSLP